MYSILIADDDYYQGERYMDMDIWEKYGFEVTAAVQTERQAVDFLKKNGADLVLTEVSRPQLNGVRLAQEIKRLYGGTKVVFFSQRSDFEAARMGMRLGVLDYILKPADETELSQMLSRAKCVLDEKSGGTLCVQAENVLKSIGKGSESRFVRTVAVYLCDNIYRFATMSSAADFMNLNKDYFGKRFRKETGISFNEFCNRLRIEFAKSLIEKGTLRTYEIAEKLGFGDPDYFTKKFKEQTGITPSEYKASLKPE